MFQNYFSLINCSLIIAQISSASKSVAISFQAMSDSELFSFAKQLQVPIDLLRETAKLGRLPVVNFAAGGLGNDQFLGSWQKL